jgi:hypothetical protein
MWCIPTVWFAEGSLETKNKSLLHRGIPWYKSKVWDCELSQKKLFCPAVCCITSPPEENITGGMYARHMSCLFPKAADNPGSKHHFPITAGLVFRIPAIC